MEVCGVCGVGVGSGWCVGGHWVGCVWVVCLGSGWGSCGGDVRVVVTQLAATRKGAHGRLLGLGVGLGLGLRFV